MIKLRKEGLASEYQAINSDVVCSQVLSGASYMNIAGELEKHAAEELSHALIISEQIDCFGGMPAVSPRHLRTSKKPKEMLQFDLENEMATIRHDRERVRRCESLGEYAKAQYIREILKDEQNHLFALATALGEGVPMVTSAASARAGS